MCFFDLLLRTCFLDSLSDPFAYLFSAFIVSFLTCLFSSFIFLFLA
ncbi:unnamed protein product [Arabidopsis halleri]